MDYHLHTAVTIDGKMDEMEACARAAALGIHEIAFTNHVMLKYSDYTISLDAFRRHYEQINACQALYPYMAIRIGLEVDYYPNRETEIANVIANYEMILQRPFDLILGAVHEVNGGFFSNKHLAPAFYASHDLLSLYRAYFDLAAQAVTSRLFDVLAHPDLIKKYTNDLTPPVPFDQYRAFVEPLIDALIASRVGIEFNTKGLKLPLHEAYPSDEFLQLYLSKCHALGIEPIFTIGSDAHKADDVGYMILEAHELLRQRNVTTLTSFDQHQQIPLEIS